MITPRWSCIAARGSRERTVEWPKLSTLIFAQGTAESNRDQTENWEWVNADAGWGSRGEKKEAGNVENSMTDSQFSSAKGIFRNEFYLLELSIR